jgi:Methyltransferase domain
MIDFVGNEEELGLDLALEAGFHGRLTDNASGGFHAFPQYIHVVKKRARERDKRQGRRKAMEPTMNSTAMNYCTSAAPYPRCRYDSKCNQSCGRRMPVRFRKINTRSKKSNSNSKLSTINDDGNWCGINQMEQLPRPPDRIRAAEMAAFHKNDTEPAHEPLLSNPHWKRSQHVVHQLLRHLALPRYEASLPPAPDDPDWPYTKLPAAARVWGPWPGQMADPVRARAKEDQVRSLLRCIVPWVPHDKDDNTTEYTMVDFGGGTGHLSIPLSLLFPHCRVICVDLGRRSLQLLHQKAAQCVHPNAEAAVMSDHDSNMPQLQATAIPNLFTFLGPVHTLEPKSFDMAIALHLCGEATDTVLRMAARQNAVLLAAPCCVGKLATTARNPYIFQATGANRPTISYPQSRRLRARLGAADWNALARAADGADRSAGTPAKTLVELDRALFLQEQFGYRTRWHRIVPATATPKRDLLVAGPATVVVPEESPVDPEAVVRESDPWETSWDPEADAMRRQLLAWMDDPTTSEERAFPTGMGARRRKVIHQQAEGLRLKHWGIGHKNADKTVVVAKPTIKP